MIVPLVIARNKISNSRIMPQKAVINVLYNSQQADIAGCICQGQHILNGSLSFNQDRCCCYNICHCIRYDKLRAPKKKELC